MVDATVVPAGPPLQPQPVAPSASSGHRGVHFAEASTSSADPTWAFPEADEQASVEYEAYDDEHQAAIDAAGGWTIQEDPTSGALYYYNVYTNESTYDMPPCFAELASSREAWLEVGDGTWQNQITGAISATGYVGTTAVDDHASSSAAAIASNWAQQRDADAGAQRAPSAASARSPSSRAAAAAAAAVAARPENSDQGWDSTCTESGDDEQGSLRR